MTLPKFAVANEVSKFSNQYELIIIYQHAHLASTSYNVNEFQNLKKSKNVYIFHTNINGLESKFDNLQEFVSSTVLHLN